MICSGCGKDTDWPMMEFCMNPKHPCPPKAWCPTCWVERLIEHERAGSLPRSESPHTPTPSPKDSERP